MAMVMKLVISVTVVALRVCWGKECSQLTDCLTCTSSPSWVNGCRWCPLDRACHAFGSIGNPCKTDMSVLEPNVCYNTSDKTFDSTLSFKSAIMSSVAYTYHPQLCLDKKMPTEEYKVIEVVAQKCNDFLFDDGDCFAFIAVSHKIRNIMVSFRGSTSVKQVVEEMVTALFLPKTDFIGGKVQEYFKNAFSKLFPCVQESVKEAMSKYPQYDVVVTGHSLGGALASLTAAALVVNKTVASDRLSLYTFGCPRVGNKDYAYIHDKLVKNSWRVVHTTDIVPHLPTCNFITGCDVTNGPYHHKMEVFFPATDMTVNSRYTICKADEDDECSNKHVASCFVDIFNTPCINEHRVYYDINMSQYCQDIAGRSRRPRELSDIPEHTCKRIKF